MAKPIQKAAQKRLQDNKEMSAFIEAYTKKALRDTEQYKSNISDPSLLNTIREQAEIDYQKVKNSGKYKTSQDVIDRAADNAGANKYVNQAIIDARQKTGKRDSFKEKYGYSIPENLEEYDKVLKAMAGLDLIKTGKGGSQTLDLNKLETRRMLALLGNRPGKEQEMFQQRMESLLRLDPNAIKRYQTAIGSPVPIETNPEYFENKDDKGFTGFDKPYYTEGTFFKSTKSKPTSININPQNIHKDATPENKRRVLETFSHEIGHKLGQIKESPSGKSYMDKEYHDRETEQVQFIDVPTKIWFRVNKGTVPVNKKEAMDMFNSLTEREEKDLIDEIYTRSFGGNLNYVGGKREKIYRLIKDHFENIKQGKQKEVDMFLSVTKADEKQPQDKSSFNEKIAGYLMDFMKKEKEV